MKVHRYVVGLLLLTGIIVSPRLSAQDYPFDTIARGEIMSTPLSSTTINGSNDSTNQIPTGAIVLYKTKAGRFGKFKVVSYGYNLTLKWRTYNSNGTLFSGGDNLVILGTWLCDLDSGKQVGSLVGSDFLWDQTTTVKRSIDPQNGAKMAVYDCSFESVSFAMIKAAYTSTSPINGSNDSTNRIPTGATVLYKTDAGRFGKFKVVSYGYNLTLKWRTYNSNGTLFSGGDSLVIQGTWSCDLDLGKQLATDTSIDFWWDQATTVKRSLDPQNGAKLAVYDCLFDRITPDKIPSASLSANHINGSNDSTNQIPVGATLLYRTVAGRYGKLKITSYGYNLAFKWRTYNADSTLFSAGDSLAVQGTWLCDLDTGKQVGSVAWADFFWDQATAVQRSLDPANGALFGSQLTITSVEQSNNAGGRPQSIYLSQNYPNPFNPSTTIEFTLTRSARVTLTVYDVLGRQIVTLVDQAQFQSGTVRKSWDGKDSEGREVATGVYFCKFIARPDDGGDIVLQTKKMLMMK